MRWQDSLPTKGSEPETKLWTILDEMCLKYDMNVPEDFWTVPRNLGFSIYPREIDVLVENCLAIEVQGSGPKLHDKPLRRRKDAAKRRSMEARGLAWMEIWDYELKKSDQKRAGQLWRPKLKEAITKMLEHGQEVHRQYLEHLAKKPKMPTIDWPGVGEVTIDGRCD